MGSKPHGLEPDRGRHQWDVSPDRVGKSPDDFNAGLAGSADRQFNQPDAPHFVQDAIWRALVARIAVSAMQVADWYGRRVLGQMRRFYGPPAHIKM